MYAASGCTSRTLLSSSRTRRWWPLPCRSVLPPPRVLWIRPEGRQVRDGVDIVIILRTHTRVSVVRGTNTNDVKKGWNFHLSSLDTHQLGAGPAVMAAYRAVRRVVGRRVAAARGAAMLLANGGDPTHFGQQALVDYLMSALRDIQVTHLTGRAQLSICCCCCCGCVLYMTVWVEIDRPRRRQRWGCHGGTTSLRGAGLGRLA